MIPYAQINEAGMVIGVSRLSREVEKDNLIRLAESDDNLIGQYYNPNTGEFEEITATADKQTIVADGMDAATITTKLPSVLSEISFYDGSGNLLDTVEAVDGIAILQVTSTASDDITIRAGHHTMSRKNEVTIHAS